jgi:hypothetical protein
VIRALLFLRQKLNLTVRGKKTKTRRMTARLRRREMKRRKEGKARVK